MITNFKKTENIENFSNEEINLYKGEGAQLIVENKIGVVVLAGGQGTRLGLNKPKGTLELNGKSLFQIHAEKIKHLVKIFCVEDVPVKIPWYIMTSCNTHNDTVQYFEENDYFGLEKTDVTFFEQGNNYCLDVIGGNKIVNKYDRNGKPVYTTCPNGSGGLYKAIHDNGLYDDFLKRGLKYIFIQNVDNPLVKLCDPILLGYTEHNNLDISCKVCTKQDPEEKVGIFCYKDNQPSIVEYYELPDEMRYLRDGDGELVYNQANISVYLLSIDFIGATKNYDMENHYAKKKIEYWDENLKQSIKPDKENGYKPESFIFDVFRFCPKEKMGLLVISRESEFCPIKNKEHVINAEKRLKQPAK